MSDNLKENKKYYTKGKEKLRRQEISDIKRDNKNYALE